jgi:hypothetical protein
MAEAHPIAKLMHFLVRVAINNSDCERPGQGVTVGLLAATIAATIRILVPPHLRVDGVIVHVNHETSP